MKKHVHIFNSICGILILFFVFSTIRMWTVSTETNTGQNIEHIKVVKKEHPPISEKNKETILKEVKKEEPELKKEIVKKKELPKEVNLDVPFTSQAPEFNWDQPWQDACEEAAVLMLDAYYKGYNLIPIFSRDEMLKMIDWETKQGWKYSITIEKIRTLFEHVVSKKGRITKDPTIAEIKESIAAGHPVLVVANGKQLANPYFSDGGPDYHALIIRGYTEDSFITNDPGTKRGKNFVYSYENLMNAIHDWNGGDVRNGERVVLVSE